MFARQKVDTRARRKRRADEQKGRFVDPRRGQNRPLQVLRRAAHRPLLLLLDAKDEAEAEAAQGDPQWSSEAGGGAEKGLQD